MPLFQLNNPWKFSTNPILLEAGVPIMWKENIQFYKMADPCKIYWGDRHYLAIFTILRHLWANKAEMDIQGHSIVEPCCWLVYLFSQVKIYPRISWMSAKHLFYRHMNGTYSKDKHLHCKKVHLIYFNPFPPLPGLAKHAPPPNKVPFYKITSRNK